MPRYTFKNTLTNEEWTDHMSIAERTKLLEDNPHYIQVITSFPATIDPLRLFGLKSKTGSEFNNMMRTIAKNNAGSTLDTGNISEV